MLKRNRRGKLYSKSWVMQKEGQEPKSKCIYLYRLLHNKQVYCAVGSIRHRVFKVIVTGMLSFRLKWVTKLNRVKPLGGESFHVT